MSSFLQMNKKTTKLQVTIQLTNENILQANLKILHTNNYKSRTRLFTLNNYVHISHHRVDSLKTYSIIIAELTCVSPFVVAP